ncbi:unnamed protein product [Phytophthora lilii]|uniref:Unnamed protein product n=1 Tax=Phytophthora lilii TaxID=2077276 RepID=A0A9W6WTI4_9STRA|nr:unnamed protein product [Phytophthora lilii]
MWCIMYQPPLDSADIAAEPNAPAQQNFSTRPGSALAPSRDGYIACLDDRKYPLLHAAKGGGLDVVDQGDESSSFGSRQLETMAKSAGRVETCANCGGSCAWLPIS